MNRSILAVMLLGAWLSAQEPPRDPIAEHLFPPDLVMANQRAIGLDDAQKAFLRAELIKAQTKFTETQFQLQDNMEALVSLIRQSPANEAKVAEQLDKVLALEREMKRAQIGLMVRIKNKLTTEQQARLRQIRTEMRQRPLPRPGANPEHPANQRPPNDDVPDGAAVPRP